MQNISKVLSFESYHKLKPKLETKDRGGTH